LSLTMEKGSSTTAMLKLRWNGVRSRLKIETQILLLLAMLAISILLFLHLASEVVEGDTLAFDRAILLALRRPEALAVPVGPVWFPKVMTEITAIGGGTVLTMMTVLVVGYLVAAKRTANAVFVIVAVSGGAILSAILKHFFERPRPELVPHLVRVSSASFPSGHAMNSAVVYLTLGTLLAKSERTAAVRIYLMGAAILLTILVGFSRVYLGVHWPTDVVAGWCVGSIWALVCSMIAQHLQDRRTLERTKGKRGTLTGH
jgi:undecaprenyl-diphosphatase